MNRVDFKLYRTRFKLLTNKKNRQINNIHFNFSSFQHKKRRRAEGEGRTKGKILNLPAVPFQLLNRLLMGKTYWPQSTKSPH